MACVACQTPTIKYGCRVCRSALYCSARCANQFTPEHERACRPIGAGLKRERERDLPTAVREGNEEAVRGWEGAMKQPEIDALLMEAPTASMARLLVNDFGANPYAYAGGGLLVLDRMVRHGYQIREFLRQHGQPVSAVVRELQMWLAYRAADEPYELFQFSVGRLGVPLTVPLLRELVYHGFFPMGVRDDDGPTSEATLVRTYLEHLFFERYNQATLDFWYLRSGPEYFLGRISEFSCGTLEAWKRYAETEPVAWPFLVLDPSHLYPSTAHPRSDMAMFRSADSLILDERPEPWENAEEDEVFLPVVRYASGKDTGLYYENAPEREMDTLSSDDSWFGSAEDEEEGEHWMTYYTGGWYDDDSTCGTFFYLEPDSTTYLRVAADRVLVATNKLDALMQLLVLDNEPTLLRSAGARELLESLDTEDNALEALMLGLQKARAQDSLLMAPDEWIAYLRGRYQDASAWEATLSGRPVQRERHFYTGELLHLYAIEDVFDQVLCRGAAANQIDCIVLTHMVGARQVVGEVLHTRSRWRTWKELHYLELK